MVHSLAVYIEAQLGSRLVTVWDLSTKVDVVRLFFLSYK